MDVFCEYMVKRQKSMKDTLIAAGIVIAALFLSMLVFLFLFGRVLGFEIFIVAAIWYGAFVLIRRTDLEFEYILTNSVLDIDKIMGKKTRKRVMSIDFKNIEACAPANGVTGSNNPAVKVLDFAGDITGNGVYYVDFSKNSQMYRVFFQPNAKMLGKIRLVNPRLITVNEEDVQ